jgi:hypothetical protein
LYISHLVSGFSKYHVQAALDHLLHCLTRFLDTFQRHGLDPEIISQATEQPLTQLYWGGGGIYCFQSGLVLDLKL